MLDTPASFYEPSKRSLNWLKVKKDYLAGIGDSLDLVVLGAYFGKGKRTSVYGAFLLACYDANPQNPSTVRLQHRHRLLRSHPRRAARQAQRRRHRQPKPFYNHSTVIPKDQPDVWFEPRFVWEVKTADLTLSPRYQGWRGGVGGGLWEGDQSEVSEVY